LVSARLNLDIDWSSASIYIRHEGFYFFGGKDSENQVYGDLYIIEPSITAKAGLQF